MKSIVQAVGLSHRYTTSWAIRDVNIEINGTGIYGLLGSNGAGKSTTMNILCGVLNQTQGEVYINGIDIRKQPIAAKKHIGFLPQTAPLYLDLTVREYLRYCMRLRLMNERDIPAAMAEVLKKCGIDQVRDRLIKNLSGGYRQRVGLAQSIVHKPKLVILDEPTNGLDPLQIVEVRHLIREIAEERTVILSSHVLSEIQQLCQDIIMIEKGRVVFSDSMEAFANYNVPQSMLIEFENAPSPETLGQVRGVNRVERVNAQTVRVFYNGDKSVSEAIIAASVQNGWRLVQLSIERNSMDEVFKQLTNQAKDN